MEIQLALVLNANAMQEGREEPDKAPTVSSRPSRTLPTHLLFPSTVPPKKHTRQPSRDRVPQRPRGRGEPISCKTPPHSAFGGRMVRGKGEGVGVRGRGRSRGRLRAVLGDYARRHPRLRRNFWGLIWFSLAPALHFVSQRAPKNLGTIDAWPRQARHANTKPKTS